MITSYFISKTSSESHKTRQIVLILARPSRGQLADSASLTVNLVSARGTRTEGFVSAGASIFGFTFLLDMCAPIFILLLPIRTRTYLLTM
jgi:hypothetical protein